MNHADLPEDYLAFINSGSQLEYDPDECEVGRVILFASDKLTPSVAFVDSYDTPYATSDPHAEEDGYYVVPIVNLIAECEGYDADGILIWLPDQKLFGAWDSEYWDVLTFPDVTWRDIRADPVKYLNALWEPEAVRHEYLRPFPTSLFKAE